MPEGPSMVDLHSLPNTHGGLWWIQPDMISCLPAIFLGSEICGTKFTHQSSHGLTRQLVQQTTELSHVII